MNLSSKEIMLFNQMQTNQYNHQLTTLKLLQEQTPFSDYNEMLLCLHHLITAGYVHGNFKDYRPFRPIYYQLHDRKD